MGRPVCSVTCGETHPHTNIWVNDKLWWFLLLCLQVELLNHFLSECFVLEAVCWLTNRKLAESKKRLKALNHCWVFEASSFKV